MSDSSSSALFCPRMVWSSDFDFKSMLGLRISSVIIHSTVPDVVSVPATNRSYPNFDSWVIINHPN